MANNAVADAYNGSVNRYNAIVCHYIAGVNVNNAGVRTYNDAVLVCIAAITARFAIFEMYIGYSGV